MPTSKTEAKGKETAAVVQFHEDFEDDDNADAVLASCDGIGFEVSIGQLLKESDWFYTFLTRTPLKAPTSSTIDPRDNTILLEEPANIIELALRIITCKPIPSTAFRTLSELEGMAAFCHKYKMFSVMSFVKIAARSRDFRKFPFKLYIIACKYRWTDVIEGIEQRCLKLDLQGVEALEAFKDAPFSYYAHLIRVKQKQQEQIEAELEAPKTRTKRPRVTG